MDIKALKTARDLIANGFCKNKVHQKVNGQDQYCAVGAVRQAVYGDAQALAWGQDQLIVSELYDRLPQEYKRAQDFIDGDFFISSQEVLSAKWSCVVQFNNDKGTTQGDVVGVFDKTLADLGGMA